MKKEYDGCSADIWASGVLLYYMLFSRLPFTAQTEKDLHKKISRGFYKIPGHINDEAKDLLQRLLQVDATKRIKASEVLMHPLFYQQSKQI